MLCKPNEMYRHAITGGYALGAFNVCSVESVLAVLDAAQAQHAPAILQVSMGARKYVRFLDDFVQMIKGYSGHYTVPVFLQHDHCQTVEDCRIAMEAGMQAVMFDGSHLSFEENIEKTREVVAIAADYDVWVEAELGCLPGFEDLVFSDHIQYTDPQMAGEFIDRTGCNALAVAIGTSHGGVLGPDYLPLDLERLANIRDVVGDFPLVLHGAASLPPEMITACNETGMKVEYWRNCSEDSIRAAVEGGIRKANMDVDNFLAFTTAARNSMIQAPDKYDPRKYLEKGRIAFQKEVEHKLRDVMLSSGQDWTL